MNMDEVRLIDADLLKTNIAQIAKCCAKSDKQKALVGRILFMIDNMPTIDAKFEKHGYWEEKPSYAEDKALGFDFQIVCSECDLQNSYFIFGEGNEPEEKTFIRSKYCPNCGARMDGDKSDRH